MLKISNLARKLRLRRFGKEDSGAVTVEFVLWVPVFILILALPVDATVLFKTQANMWTVARDVGRQMSTGLYNNAQALAYANQQFASWGIQGTANVAQTNGNVTVTVTVPVAEVAPFNIVNAFTSGTISATVVQRKEPT